MNTATEILEYYIKKKKRQFGSADSPWYIYQDGLSKGKELQLSVWYKEARKVYNLCCTHEDFAWLITNETVTLYYKYHSYQARLKKRRPLMAHDRYPQSSRRTYEKKVLSEDETRRREWRNKVKDQRNQGSRYWDEGLKKSYQVHGNRRERRHMKSKLHTGDWKEYPSSSVYWELRDCQAECCEHKPQSWEYNYPASEWDNFVSRKKREWVNPWDWS